MGATVRGGPVRVAIAVAGFILAASACVPAAVTPSPATSTAPSSARVTASAASQGPISPVVGTVTAVDPAAQASPAGSSPAGSSSASAGSTFAPVIGFTLQTSGGDTMTFKMGELDNAADFPEYQLYDRLSSGDPILVFFTIEGAELLVYHIEDAG